MVVCKKWPKYYKLKTAKSSTHPLRYHMKSQHSMDLSTALSSQKRLLVDLPQSPQPNKQKTLSTFVNKESQQQMYAELAAVDLTSCFCTAHLRGALLRVKLQTRSS